MPPAAAPAMVAVVFGGSVCCLGGEEDKEGGGVLRVVWTCVRPLERVSVMTCVTTAGGGGGALLDRGGSWCSVAMDVCAFGVDDGTASECLGSSDDGDGVALDEASSDVDVDDSCFELVGATLVFDLLGSPFVRMP